MLALQSITDAVAEAQAASWDYIPKLPYNYLVHTGNAFFFISYIH